MTTTLPLAQHRDRARLDHATDQQLLAELQDYCAEVRRHDAATRRGFDRGQAMLDACARLCVEFGGGR